MPVAPTNLAAAPWLLIGKSGMLARAWMALLDCRGIPHHDVDFPQFDLTDARSIARGVRDDFRTVLNCAGWTDVDGAEDPRKYPVAEEVNGTGVGELARRCAQTGALLVHYSTDYVFDGRAGAPYRTDQPRNPLNAYGKTKAIGEERLQASGCRRLLIRTSWMYAPWGNNFVRTIARLSKEKPVLRVVNDQRGRPTSAEHLARASLALLERGATGTFHVTDGDQCTWFDVASEVVRGIGSPCRVEPCTTAEYPRPARRPAYSVLDLSQAEALLGPMPDWRTNLAHVLPRIEGL